MNKPISLTNNWQLFLDDYLVERETGIDRRMHQPRKCGLLLAPRQPWEHMRTFFQPVHDGGRFHALYRVTWPDPEVEAYNAREGRHDRADNAFANETAYATSIDGVHWDMPHLGLVETPLFRDGEIVGQTRENNCGAPLDFIWDLGAHGNVTDPDQRFLVRLREGVGTLAGRSKFFTTKRPAPLFFASQFPDFAQEPNWRSQLVPVEGTLAPRGFANFTGWDEINEEWVAFMQGVTARWFPSREIARHRSGDFVQWSARSVLYPDAFDPHTLERYDEFMEIRVIRKGDLWLGFMAVFHSDRTSLDYSPPFVKDADFVFRDDLPRYCSRKGTTDLQLVTSRDGGHTWRRVANRQVWLPHGTEEDSFDRLSYIGVPLTVGENDYFYYMVKDGDHLGFQRDETPYYRDRMPRWDVALAVQKRDRYVSMSTGTFPAILYTRPLLLTPGTLRLNADASRGEIRVGITTVSEDGIDDIHAAAAVDGFSLEACDPMLENAVDRQVSWKNVARLDALQGKPVRLLFYIRNADLYGFRIGQDR